MVIHPAVDPGKVYWNEDRRQLVAQEHKKKLGPDSALAEAALAVPSSGGVVELSRGMVEGKKDVEAAQWADSVPRTIEHEV